MANEKICKKFSLFSCCLMTMQALRLVISTAGFCAVRFHIDCSLFNIFISRLVNAVMMSQLFGNWLGDLIVFAANGHLKLISVAAANWAEFLCFCSALICIMHTECGHLTGFYWSMVSSYFWWKVGEAPCTSIGAPDNDWYFAGFTLSGVWAAMLKGLVMMYIEEEKGIHSDVLGEVNVTVVGDVSLIGARSVKTTVDYRAAKWLFVITILITFLMCTLWDAIAIAVNNTERDSVWRKLCDMANTSNGAGAASATDNKLLAAIKAVEKAEVDVVKSVAKTPQGVEVQGSVAVVVKEGAGRELNFGTAEVKTSKINSPGEDHVTITVEKVSGLDAGETIASGEDWKQKVKKALQKAGTTGEEKKKLQEALEKADAGGTAATEKRVKAELEKLVGKDKIESVKLEGSVQTTGAFALKIKVTVNGSGKIGNRTELKRVGVWTGLVMAAIFTVPGAAMFALIFRRRKWCAALGGVTAALITRLVFGQVSGLGGEGEEWVDQYKWKGHDKKSTTTWAAMIGLGAGLVTGALVGVTVGMCIGAGMSNLDSAEKYMGQATAGGALVGGFVGLVSGEVYNGYKTWVAKETNFLEKKNKKYVMLCGIVIVVLGLGTVYSIYPGMAPCSITHFEYFNIADILILVLSAIAPIVVMVADLAEANWRLGWTILNANGDEDTAPGNGIRMWAAVVCGLLLLMSTNICEIIVLDIMQHPFSKLAQKVTNSGWRAVLLTVMMVTCQLTSSTIGFGCVAAGSGFNDGVMNVNSTLTLWTVECTGVLGEGYLTELKKYEPGKWPTQGMGKWDAYWWWNGRMFGNAWAIWCCIGTTDLRRDIMLCRQ